MLLTWWMNDRMGTYLLGTSNTTYPMKKTTREMEYSFDDRSKSVSMPDIFAFPILSGPSLAKCCPLTRPDGTYLVRSRYDNRYMSHIIGIRTRSIFRMRAFSSWGE